MNERTCRVPRCGLPAASAYSHYCRRHKSTLRRQGATQQTSIRKSELRPYLKAVSDRVARNPESPLWPELERIWDGIASDARATSERRVGNRYERLAAREVLNIAADAAPHDIVRTPSRCSSCGGTSREGSRPTRPSGCSSRGAFGRCRPVTGALSTITPPGGSGQFIGK